MSNIWFWPSYQPDCDHYSSDSSSNWLDWEFLRAFADRNSPIHDIFLYIYLFSIFFFFWKYETRTLLKKLRASFWLFHRPDPDILSDELIRLKSSREDYLRGGAERRWCHLPQPSRQGFSYDSPARFFRNFTHMNRWKLAEETGKNRARNSEKSRWRRRGGGRMAGEIRKCLKCSTKKKEKRERRRRRKRTRWISWKGSLFRHGETLLNAGPVIIAFILRRIDDSSDISDNSDNCIILLHSEEMLITLEQKNKSGFCHFWRFSFFFRFQWSGRKMAPLFFVRSNSVRVSVSRHFLDLIDLLTRFIIWNGPGWELMAVDNQIFINYLGLINNGLC